MAYLDNNAYDRKREWAAKRMSGNRKVDTLTEEQHDLLEELCRFRHELHTSWEDAFNTNSPSFGYFADNISIYSVGNSGEELPCRIEAAFGKKPYYARDYYDLNEAIDILREEGIDSDHPDYNSELNELKEQAFEVFATINDEIEAFLCEIDKEYGTNYCPSGATRIY